MIFLTDNGTEEGSRLLWTSLQAAFGDEVVGVSISESGFLPAGMTSPFAFFMGEGIPASADSAAAGMSGNALARHGAQGTGAMSGAGPDAGRPLFFNEVPVPAYWQIRGMVGQR